MNLLLVIYHTSMKIAKLHMHILKQIQGGINIVQITFEMRRNHNHQLKEYFHS